MRSPYPARRVPVDRTPSLPGAPRVRRSNLDAPARRTPSLRDAAVRSGVNAGRGSVWGSRVAPVTARRSNRRPGWESDIAGGQYVETRGTRYVL